MEERIGAAAGRQHGVVTHRQLIGAGLSPSAIKRRVRSGRLHVLHRGVYLSIPFPLPRSREMAAVLASGPDAVLSGATAAAGWGLVGAATREPHVSAPGERGRRRGIRAHRIVRLEPDEATTLDGVPITSPKRTLLDLASAPGARGLEAAVARAERLGLVTREELLAYVARKRGHRGAPALREVMALAGGPALTRSEAEAKFLALVREAGLPPPKVNVKIGRYEVDFLWREAGIAVEVDGFKYHGSQARFEGDRRRDADLLASGISVLRLTWQRIVDEPVATVVQVAQVLARARERR